MPIKKSYLTSSRTFFGNLNLSTLTSSDILNCCLIDGELSRSLGRKFNNNGRLKSQMSHILINLVIQSYKIILIIVVTVGK